ncbi:hypothetical protein ATPR_1129 [Acetobacter tropicalis NBRC 101654]|uniref:Uncharacterized protein n=1 Tax=Acetobacter tropicalis NBRC 101654 TaxID=749388 RepID=F7VCN0_9PROT|nr:hypothetical protein ATPR_1129 [Acetobacter tropicalis NBRC 101654]
MVKYPYSFRENHTALNFAIRSMCKTIAIVKAFPWSSPPPTPIKIPFSKGVKNHVPVRKSIILQHTAIKRDHLPPPKTNN